MTHKAGVKLFHADSLRDVLFSQRVATVLTQEQQIDNSDAVKWSGCSAILSWVRKETRQLFAVGKAKIASCKLNVWKKEDPPPPPPLPPPWEFILLVGG